VRWCKNGGEIVFDRHSKMQSLPVSDTLSRTKNANDLNMKVSEKKVGLSKKIMPNFKALNTNFVSMPRMMAACAA